jgi:hypothetical protein
MGHGVVSSRDLHVSIVRLSKLIPCKKTIRFPSFHLRFIVRCTLSLPAQGAYAWRDEALQ